MQALSVPGMGRGAKGAETETQYCPETLKVVLCPFLVGGLYFQYLAAFNITSAAS